ncbi:FliM/FliN family flagellar motor switch protein [Zooshikella harenae]|uniref:FliM/FliN family flagellar motor switch protein n=1 Tax=Zooshikella harenae TaxID=2827238 RepID=A0ABS5ZC73_9GAMM|nr:FliM/FliN family flagellar motor switch protein [Zooshikella harenae]MBU2711667.1 FliM/FliN family flagellar motor switch protein [Zooshikella harenae]
MIYPLTLYSKEHLFSLVSHFNSLYSKWVKKWFISCDASLAVDIPSESLSFDTKNKIQNELNIPFYGFSNWDKVLYSTLFDKNFSDEQLKHSICYSVLNECILDLLDIFEIKSISSLNSDQSTILKFGSGWIIVKLFISSSNYFSLLLPSSFIKPILQIPEVTKSNKKLTNRLNTISDKTITLKATCEPISLTLRELNSLRIGDVISLNNSSQNNLFLKSTDSKEIFNCKPCSDKQNKAVYITDKAVKF